MSPRLMRCSMLFFFVVSTVLASTERVRATPGLLTRLDATLRAVVERGVREPQRVIITVRGGRAASLRQQLTAHGDRVLADHPSANGLTAILHAEDLAVLDRSYDIVSIAADAVVRPTSLTNTLAGLTGAVGGLLKVVAEVVLPGNGDTSGPEVSPSVLRSTLGVDRSPWTGRGVGVAVVDSGIEMSEEFTGRVTAFYDFTSGGVVATKPYDDYGHGTHVAGAIGGSGALSRRNDYRGLAPGVHLIGLKVLDKTGAGFTSDVIRAVDFAVANRQRLGISVINLSLGHPIAQPAGTDPLVQAVERASRAGIVVVVAAGNLGENPTTGLPGYAGVTSPGNAPSAITVGAARTGDTVSRRDDRIPDYSSAGPTWFDALVKPDLLAPGHNIVAAAAKRSAIYERYPQLRATDPDYIRLSGTSMATAVATGVIAQLLEASRAANADGPGLTPNTVKAILQYTAVGIHNDLGLEYDPLRKGAGALNGRGAYEQASAINTSAPVGTHWLTASPMPWTELGGDAMTWNQGVIWGSAVIWGSTLAINQSAWGSAVIWGSDATWGNAVIWGSNLVWTDSQSWGNAVIWGSDAIGKTDGNAVIWGSTQDLSPASTAWKDVVEEP